MLGRFGEGSKKQGFPLDWTLSGIESDSRNGIGAFLLEGGWPEARRPRDWQRGCSYTRWPAEKLVWTRFIVCLCGQACAVGWPRVALRGSSVGGGRRPRRMSGQLLSSSVFWEENALYAECMLFLFICNLGCLPPKGVTIFIPLLQDK